MDEKIEKYLIHKCQGCGNIMKLFYSHEGTSQKITSVGCYMYYYNTARLGLTWTTWPKPIEGEYIMVLTGKKVHNLALVCCRGSIYNNTCGREKRVSGFTKVEL